MHFLSSHGRQFYLEETDYQEKTAIIRRVTFSSHFVESCLHWFEPDDIGIISGLVHVEFQKFASVL
jgi:hypothetical protein